MPERLEKWIYLAIVKENHTINNQERKVGEFIGLVEADHPAGWNLESWEEDLDPHPFLDYQSEIMKDKIDVYLIDPESFPKSIDALKLDALKNRIPLSLKLLECLDGIEEDDGKVWDENISTFYKLDFDSATDTSDGKLKVIVDNKKIVSKNIIEIEDVEKNIIVDGKIEVKIEKKEIIKKVREKKLFINQEITIPKQCKFIKLKS